MPVQPAGRLGGGVGRNGGRKIMKKIICILLMGLLLAGCVQPYDGAQNSDTEARPTVTVTYYSEPTAIVPAVEIPAVAGYDDFMSVLAAAVIDGTENKNLSPVSVYIALAMAAEGAQGQTQKELLTLLGAEKAEDMRKTAEELLESLDIQGKTGEIALADSIWLGEQDDSVTFYEYFGTVTAPKPGPSASGTRPPGRGSRIGSRRRPGRR